MLKLFNCIVFYFCLVISITNFYGQTLQNQTQSSIGSSEELSSGYYISYSIGQLSVIGKSDQNNLVICQGFQQPIELSICYDDCNPTNILTILYPNPFVDTIYFKFLGKMNEEILITIYDVFGRIVYQKSKPPIDNEVIIEGLNFVNGNYIIDLKTLNYSYTSKVIKFQK